MMKLNLRGFSLEYAIAPLIKRIRTLGMAALPLLIATPAFSQGAGIEWDILNQEVMSLYQKGQYDRAVVVADCLGWGRRSGLP